jgi:hypothetical protein
MHPLGSSIVGYLLFEDPMREATSANATKRKPACTKRTVTVNALSPIDSGGTTASTGPTPPH